MERKFFNCTSCEKNYYLEADQEDFNFDEYYCPFCGSEVSPQTNLDEDDA